MIDPLTAITIATKAFATIKGMVSAGREVEDTMGQIGKWYGAVSDFNECQKRAENPPLFKKIIAGQSVEQEAMQIYAQGKKIEQQERELRELLLWSYGPTGYSELVALRRKIREQREKTVYLQERKRKELFWNSLSIGLILILGYTSYAIFSFLISYKNGGV